VKIFCVFCGAAFEVPSKTGNFTCSKCGRTFTATGAVRPSMPSSPPRSDAPNGVLIIVIIGTCLVLTAVVGTYLATRVKKFEMSEHLRAQQSEAKANLKGIYNAEQAFFAQHHYYAVLAKDLDFEPERGNHYAYILCNDGPLQSRRDTTRKPLTDEVGFEADVYKYPASPQGRPFGKFEVAGDVIGVFGKCPDDCYFTAVAVGDIGDTGRDGEPKYDVWSISSKKRLAKWGTIEAGEPFNDAADK
jgi:hypothetical protein